MNGLLECSNNTNKLSPQERDVEEKVTAIVQIIQINLVLKNLVYLLDIQLVFK